MPCDIGPRAEHRIAPNVLERQFDAAAVNRKWVADFTYLWTAEGWLYVATVMDLFSRRIVGWSMSAQMTAQLVADALLMAIWRRGPVKVEPMDARALALLNEHFPCIQISQKYGTTETGATKSVSRGPGSLWCQVDRPSHSPGSE
jgi:putative transposase